MDYFVVKSNNHQKFRDEVFEMMDEGFQLWGGIAIAIDAIGKIWYAQAMVKTTQREELDAKSNS